MASQKFINHPLLKDDLIKKRKYQVDIFVTCTKSNCLVVVPTGLGKTIVALLLSIHQLQQEGGAIIFLAPTRPLVEQHLHTFQDLTVIDSSELLLLTGATSPSDRAQIYQEGQIKCYFMTPQILQNDIIANRLQLNQISLMIFDEAHRATGNYAYVFLAKKYIQQAQNPKILAMTASPGKNREIIEEVMANLYLNAVEIRTESDPDVKPYIQEVATIWKDVELPAELKEIKSQFEDLQSLIYHELKNNEILDSANRQKINRRDLLAATQKLDKDIAGSQNHQDLPRLLYCKKLLANAIRVSHMSELIEAQGINALKAYLEKNREQVEKGKGGKSLAELFRSTQMNTIIQMTDQLIQGNINHPKVGALMEILLNQFTDNPESRILLFCHFRDTVKFLVEILNQNDSIRAHRFIGQQKKGNSKGLSQKQQLEILDQFKSGKINTLVATSVAEEGLDISECDVVIFYDVVPSEIRAIQRRGRTGRNRSGKVIILKTLGTREEGYFWAEKHRERKMKRILNQIRRELAPKADISSKTTNNQDGQQRLTSFMKKNNQESKRNTVTSETNSENQSINLKADESQSINNQIEQAISPSNLDMTIPKNGIISSNNPFVLVDTRETASPVTRELSEKDAQIKLQQLPIGDYIISERCGIERKAVQDFIDSIKDGRLFKELHKLRSQFSIPILIIEGDINTAFSLNRNALLGTFTSLLLNMNIFFYQTQNPEETAEFVYALAKKEQITQKNKSFSIRFKKAPEDPGEKLEYIISGIPGINASRAKDLLRHFHTLQKIFTSSELELKQAPNIGPVLAKSIYKYATMDYYLHQPSQNEKKDSDAKE